MRADRFDRLYRPSLCLGSSRVVSETTEQGRRKRKRDASGGDAMRGRDGRDV